MVLDAGCGTGEITARLAAKFPAASFLGVDIEEAHLERAGARCAGFGSRVRFEAGDAMSLAFADGTFDLVVCRHLIQAVSDARRVLEELRRVTKPGGRLHLIAEDYGMLHCYPTELDADGFWQRFPPRYSAGTGCDLHDLGLTGIRCDYVVVDTLRVPRDTFARIWEAWRDGYTDSIALHAGVAREEIERRWREMIDCVRDPRGYALWQVPVWTAARPAEA
jgi:ubiquinone/menaquinone biosynthesis C-methylase UbiE